MSFRFILFVIAMPVRLLVADTLPPDGSKLIDSKGRRVLANLDAGEPIDATGITATRDGAYYFVADDSSGEIIVFDVLGSPNYRYAFPQLDGPAGMDITSDDSAIYVCSRNNDHIVVFDPAGAALQQFPTTGLTNPCDVAIANDDSVIYVASEASGLIGAFDPTGTPIFTFAAPGVDFRPSAIAVTSDGGLIYAVSSLSSRVDVFKSDGQGLAPTLIPSIQTPTDIDVASLDDLLYVPNVGNARVEIVNASLEYVSATPAQGFVGTESRIVVDSDDSTLGLTNFALLYRDCNSNEVSDACEHPECSGILVGDMNCDGLINGLDVASFLHFVVGESFVCQADINQDGAVDLTDIPDFASLLVSG